MVSISAFSSDVCLKEVSGKMKTLSNQVVVIAFLSTIADSRNFFALNYKAISSPPIGIMWAPTKAFGSSAQRAETTMSNAPKKQMSL